MMMKALNEKYGFDAEKIKGMKQRKSFTVKHADSVIEFALKVFIT